MEAGIYFPTPGSSPPEPSHKRAPKPPVTNIAEEVAAGRALLSTLPGAIDFALVGSAAYRRKPNDVDFVVLLAPGLKLGEFALAMYDSGWSISNEYKLRNGGDCWTSVRRGKLNLILTDNRKFFDGYVLSTEVCKVLRLAKRDDRVAVHEVVRDRRLASEVRP